MVADLVLFSEAADMVGNVCPRSEPVRLGTFYQEKLLVGAPFAVEYGKGVLLNDPERVRRGVVGVARLALGEARDAEVEIRTGRVCTSNTDLDWEGQLAAAANTGAKARIALLPRYWGPTTHRRSYIN